MKLIPVLLLSVSTLLSQSAPKAVLVDGEGPWRDDRWNLAVTEFSRLLSDAGYSTTTVRPADLPAAIGSSDLLLAVPSLENLPVETLQAVTTHQADGGNVMSSGGEPFRNAGPFLAPSVETLSPWYKQYTNSAGLRVPIARGRGLTAMPDPQGRYRVIGDLLSPAATFFTNSQIFGSGFGSTIIWLPWPQLSEPLRTQFVAALR